MWSERTSAALCALLSPISPNKSIVRLHFTLRHKNVLLEICTHLGLMKWWVCTISQPGVVKNVEITLMLSCFFISRFEKANSVYHHVLLINLFTFGMFCNFFLSIYFSRPLVLTQFPHTAKIRQRTRNVYKIISSSSLITPTLQVSYTSAHVELIPILQKKAWFCLTHISFMFSRCFFGKVNTKSACNLNTVKCIKTAGISAKTSERTLNYIVITFS